MDASSPVAAAQGASPFSRAVTGAGFFAGLLLVAPHALLTSMALARAGWPAAELVAFFWLWGLAMAVSRRGLSLGLTLLGFSPFLFGAQSYVYPGVAFGLLADVAALAFCWRNAGGKAASGESTGPTGALLAALAALALGSTLLLPWARFWQELSLFGPGGFFAAMAFSPADAPGYALAGAWRLAIFAVLAFGLARLDFPDRFGCLIRGLVGGLLTAIVFGLYEHFQGDHYLLHYRFTSLFANPGWFAEYAAVAAPYLLTLLAGANLRRRALAALGLALCGAAMVLTLARAGWIAGSLTFFAAGWLYFRENRFVRFRRPYGHLPTLAVAGALVVGIAFWGAGRELSAISRPINALLAKRVDNFTDSPRPTLFRSGLLIAAERPVFGMGFTSYARHYPVLLATPGAWLNRYGDPRAEVFETPHSMYVQLAAGLGAAGLLVWLAMVGRAGWVLWRRARDYASLPDAALLLSLAAFHVYAFFQEMFYVPAVLFLLFIPLARAMALEAGAAREGRARGTGWVRAAAGGVALCGILAYGLDIGLGGTAARLGLYDWMPPGEKVVFEGFYPPEQGQGRTFRWSAGDAALLVPPGTGSLTLSLAAASPTEATFFSPAGLWARVGLDGGPVTVTLPVPETGDGRAVPLYLLTTRAFVPQAATGAADPRRLGVAVGVVGRH
ncbi:O-antigen polymerase [Solidesulfovibrio fructosivorans JJ]]|uniref:O-antigen polymerase n=1 Tax=Solidesulfovibrio fructosivorans JJ] TaxID=596151 RepID=E1JZT0_SOLFR|nr:O-antigen ligase family protein [Solidesulfovibrio fructosivorans]EFL50110.1 O-antigen polymerase [Solidesulfovibrio fructosivorans JJ]]